MEMYCQNQGYAGYNNNYNSGYYQQMTSNDASRNQVSAESYAASSPQMSQAMSQPSEQPQQPQMPPEAEAALNQMKSMPCPKSYFPANMLNNADIPTSPQCNCRSGGNGYNNPGYSMFQNNMHGAATPDAQNPHAANNPALHAQNFQLHHDLHGAGTPNQGYTNPNMSPDFGGGIANAQKQHSLNPQLHDKNRLMHQNLHGFGSSKGPQHAQAQTSTTPFEKRSKAGSQPSNNQQMTPSTNYVSQGSSNPAHSTPCAQTTPCAHGNMGNYSAAGHQSMAQPTTAHQTGNYHATQSDVIPYTEPNAGLSYPAGQFATSYSVCPHKGQHATTSASAGAQPTSNYYAANNASQMGQYATHQHATPTNAHMTNQHYASHTPASHGATSQPSAHYTADQSAYQQSNLRSHSYPDIQQTNHHEAHQHYSAHNIATNEAENKYHQHSTQPTSDVVYHTHSHMGPTNDLYTANKHMATAEHEPHLSVVQRTDGHHKLAEYENNLAASGGEMYSMKPYVSHEDSYPVQQPRGYSSLTGIQRETITESAFEKNDGLQGNRSLHTCAPKSWVIGPPKRNKADWMKNYS